MSIVASQPTVRFNAAGPYGIEGISYVPKVITVKKTVTTATENDDFMLAPTGTFITEVIAVVTDACDGNTTVTLGTDGDADALINATNFSVETLGNFYKFSTGYYLPSGDTLRIAVGGTPAAGEVEFLISYFEIPSMMGNGIHFEL